MPHPINSTNAYLERAYSLQSTSEARELYNEWANSYDADLKAERYAFPTLAAEALIASLPSDLDISSARVLDAGCGTGLVGVVLAGKGAKTVDGVDLSPGMLAVAGKTGVYRALRETDLTKPLESADGEYDAVICVGTLTTAHVGPAVLGEFVRVVKGQKRGVVSFTVSDPVWEAVNREIDELVSSGLVEMARKDVVGILEGEESGGRVVVLRKL